MAAQVLKEKIKAQIKIEILEAAINGTIPQDKTAVITTTVNQVEVTLILNS